MFAIALQINAKITEFKVTQTIVASLLEEPTTAKLVDKARECAEKMDKDLIALKVEFVKVTNKIKEVLKIQKTTSGSGMSHQWVLGACWGLGP